MKYFARVAGVCTAVAGIAFGAFAAHSEPIKIKYAAYHASNSVFMQAQQDMMKAITERTGGKVTFETYYSGSLLKAQDLYPGLARGVADMVTSVAHAFNPKEFPLSGVTLPFITDNVYAATLAYSDWYEASPEVQKEFERNGAHFLFGMPAAENVLWTQKKVTKAEDLKGMRIRMLLGPGEALSLLGATAVATPYTESIDLLQRGGVDGISATFFEQGVRDGLGDVANYLSSAGRMGIFAVNVTSISNKVWNKLSPDVQKIFQEEAGKAKLAYIKAHGEAMDEAVDILRKAKKVEVVALDSAEEKRWREMTKDALYAKYNQSAKQVNADGKALIERFQNLVAKYESQYPYETGIDRYLAGKK